MKSNIDDDFELENLRLAALKSMKHKNEEKNKIQSTVSDRSNEREFKKNKKNFNKPNHLHFKNIQPTKFHFNQPRSNLIVLTSENDVDLSNSNEQKNSIRNKPNKFQKYQNNQKNFKRNDLKEDNKNDSLPTRFSRIEKDSSDEDEESDSDDEVIEKYRQTYFDCNEDIPLNENKTNNSLKEESNQDELKIQNLIAVEKETFEDEFDLSLETKNSEQINDKKSKKNYEKVIEQNSEKKNDDNCGNYTFKIENSKNELVIEEKKENNDKMILRNKKRVYDLEKDNFSKKANQNEETKRKNLKTNEEDKSNLKERRKIIFEKDDSSKLQNKQKFLHDITDKNSKKIDKNERNSRVQILNKSNIVRLISNKNKNEDIEMKPNYKTNHESSLKKMRSLVVKK